MVGGIVVETIVLDDRVWIEVEEAGSSSAGQRCALHVERTAPAECVSEGDSLWWQGTAAYWTPSTRSFTDFKLKRIGFSGVGRPITEPANT